MTSRSEIHGIFSIATSFPESWARTDVANMAASRGFPWACPSEVRQVRIRLTLTNQSKRPVTLEFPTNQRIEIYLRYSAGEILTKWSDNHAIAEKPGTVLINPQEHVEYNETIATRDLTPNKVFIAEVFFPKYPELRIQQKFLAVP